MKNREIKNEHLINELNERAKELNCLYQINEILDNQHLSLPEIFKKLVKVIPSGWQFSDYCKARIIYKDNSYQEDDFFCSGIYQKSCIEINGEELGKIEVYYSSNIKREKSAYFLKKEEKLI